VLDDMVELYITQDYRKFVKQLWYLPHPTNTPLEKSLFHIIDKNYIFSLGRLFGILSDIQNSVWLGYYGEKFSAYLDHKKFLKEALLDANFFLQWEILLRLWILSEKRHHGILSQQDTATARRIILGDFSQKNSLLGLLAQAQSTDFTL
jgi:hypothetical protein